MYNTKDILKLNHSPDFLFLMRGNFYPWTWMCSYVLLWTGACFESRYCWTVKMCKICDRKFIAVEFMDNGYCWQHFDSFVFLSEQWFNVLYMYNWEHFHPIVQRELRVDVWWTFQLTICKLPSVTKTFKSFRN
jgi:hypothetical protein